MLRLLEGESSGAGGPSSAPAPSPSPPAMPTPAAPAAGPEGAGDAVMEVVESDDGSLLGLGGGSTGRCLSEEVRICMDHTGLPDSGDPMHARTQTLAVRLAGGFDQGVSLRMGEQEGGSSFGVVSTPAARS